MGEIFGLCLSVLLSALSFVVFECGNQDSALVSELRIDCSETL